MSHRVLDEFVSPYPCIIRGRKYYSQRENSSNLEEIMICSIIEIVETKGL